MPPRWASGIGFGFGFEIKLEPDARAYAVPILGTPGASAPEPMSELRQQASRACSQSDQGKPHLLCNDASSA
jgi:hypothetical protein